MKQMAAKETGKVASGVGENQEDLFINDTTLCVCVLSRVQLFEAPWTVACQVSLFMISQARILEWVAIFYSRGSSQPRDRTCISCVSSCFKGKFFTTELPGKPGLS